MRTITKGAEPRELIQWKAENAETRQNLVYGGGSFPAEDVRRALLIEQFHLCAYTLRRLKTPAECEESAQDTRASCHIEHLLPQSRNVQGEDIDYQNIVACYPPSQSTVMCDFGAKFKDDFDPTTGKYIDRKRVNSAKKSVETLAGFGRFVSPLYNNVEVHFNFEPNGKVEGATRDGDLTIEVLRLNNPTLINDRAAVIKGYLEPKGKKITALAARRLAHIIMQPDAHRCLEKYCVAIAQAAIKHAEKEERRALCMRNQRN